MLLSFAMFNLIFLSVILLVISKPCWSSEINGRVSQQGETFNFELSGQKNWDYDVKRIKDKNGTKVQLSFKPQDQFQLEQISNIENPFVKSIKVLPKNKEGQYLIEFVLKDEKTETFDYLTDQPSKLIVDFYQSEAIESDLKAPVKLIKTEKKIEEKKLNKTNVKKNLTNEKKREPADVDYLRITEPGGIESSFISKSGLYDGGDTQFSRFLIKESEYKEESVIRSENNYYIRFPILESEFSFWNKMKENPPLYEITEKNDSENKEARLLKLLYDKKRYLVFKKTFEWFENKYPQSKYLEVLTFMLGDVLYNLSLQEKVDSIYDQAQAIYTKALNQYPNSPLAERTSLMTGMLSIEKLDYMAAIRKLNLHAENKKYKSKISRHYAQIGMAYSLSQLNKLDDALNVLSQIEKESKDPLVLASTAVYRGDFYFHAKKYDQAIATYENAIKKNEAVSVLFPSAFFNKMEAQFWQKKYKESHQSALDFTKNFTTHSFAPYALTRVGELLDIIGADQSKSVGAFLETHFRYGDSPKTIVARLHLLSTRMKSMKPEELDETLKKMDRLAERSELENIDQFKTAMIADGFAKRKNFTRAVTILSEFFQQNPTRPDSKQVSLRIIRNINDELKNLSDQKDYRNLLKTYKEYSDTWLKGQSRIDTDYMLGLAYESAGAYSASIDRFTKTAKRLANIKNTADEKVIRVQQYLPTTEGLDLKIALNAFENKDFQLSYQVLEKIKNPLSLSEEEQVDRILLASKLYEQKGDTETSIRYLSELSRLWNGRPELALPAVTRLADMQSKHNQIQDAMATYKKSVEIILKQEKPEPRILHQISRSYLELLIQEKQNDEAKNMLSQIVQKFDPQINLSEQKYQLGLLHFKNGELKKAQQTWDTLSEAEDQIWKKLASEKLKQAGWDENYKKYIKRIPAMSQLEGAQ